MLDSEARLWMLEETLRYFLPLLEQPVGVFLILCVVLAALALALYVCLLVAEFRKERQ